MAQHEVGSWGCLWVEKHDPGEQLLQWCVLDERRDRVPCYFLEADERAPATELEPWVVIDSADITERLAPNEGLCPKLPADIPPVDNIRNPSS